VIGVVDTNCDPEEVDFVIPGNDDALRSIRLFTSRMADAILAGRGMRESARVEAQAEADASAATDRAARAASRRPRPDAPPAAAAPVAPTA